MSNTIGAGLVILVFDLEERLMNTEKQRQTTLRVTHSKIPEWHRRLQQMQACSTLDALVSLYGPPHHKIRREGSEIWHYPLGVESGMLYSIHVAVRPDQSKQVYMHFEPSRSPRRHWWQFWKKKAPVVEFER